MDTPVTPDGPPSGLGNIVPLGNAATLPKGSPPSSYAAYAVLDGEKGAIIRFAGLTILRSLLIAPGVAIMGIRGKQLVLGSLAGSGVISLSALGYVWYSRKQAAAEAVAPLPTTDPPLETTGEEIPVDVGA